MRLLFPTLIMLALLAAKAAPAPALELAVQDDPVLLNQSYGDTQLALDRAVEMGAERIRVNLRWADAMSPETAAAADRPADVQWDFSALERLHAAAAQRGLLLQVTLTGPAPAWATSDGKIGNRRPSAAAFADFAGAAATAFAGRIDRWSIWNEPNWHRLLSPAKRAPSLYRSLFRHGAAAIRAAAPQADVLIGELMPGRNSRRSTPALKFLRGFTCTKSNWRASKRCGALKADGFALHPYYFARRPKSARAKNRDIVEIGSLSRLTKALDRLRNRRALVTPSGRKMPVYLTEFGYFTDGPVAVSPSRHASWMREAWRIAERNRRVRQLLQYQLIDPWPDETSWRTAVLERDGTPRPVFRALASLAR